MKKVNIFSVFLFITVTFLIYVFSFTTKVYALDEVITPTEVPEVPAVITKEEVVTPTIVSSDIESDITWKQDGSPYLVTNSILVKKGATLTIEAGVIVKFEDEARLVVNGSIDAEGTAKYPIYFTSAKDDTLGGDTNNDGDSTTPSKGDWDVVTIASENDPPLDDSDLASSTLNYITLKYSDRGFLIFDKEVSSEGLHIDNQISLFNSNSTFHNISSFKINLSETSVVTIDGSTLNSADGSVAVRVSDASKLDISNSSINGCQDCGSTVLVFGGSTLTLDSVQVNIEDKDGYTFGIGIFDEGTNLIMKKSTEIGANMGMIINTGAKAKVEDSVFECTDRCIEGDGGSILMTNSKISGASEFGILSNDSPRTSHECTEVYNEEEDYFEEVCEDIILEGSLFEINNNEIFGNGVGINSYGGKIIGKNNNIHDNTIDLSVPPVGASNLSEEKGGVVIDLKNNFWGDKTGPTHLSNLNGIGDIVSDNIIFTPWLEYDPLNISNVMFIPGFQASRLYKMEGDISLGTEYEKTVWEPGLLSDPSSMYMDENGESIDKDIYTREVMGRAKLLGIGVLDFYKSFFEKLDGMVTDGEIGSWKEIAYDWRFSPLDIVKRGIEDGDGNISYTEKLINGEVPYIIEQLQKLVDTSHNDKVTIVTHSNGGLVAKALVAKLIEMKSDLIDHIDNLIVVAPPLVGTPKATAGILHGYEQGMFFNLFLGRKDARDLGETLPGAYGLLPSEKYLSGVNNNLILLDPSLDKLNDWRSKYGDAIDTYLEFKNFLLDNLRLDGGHNDLVNPSILNGSILEKVGLLHSVIDNIEIPSNIKVHQVAGWGLPTANDIRYNSKNECTFFIGICLKKKVVLSVDAGFTSGGDSTVVGGSALFDLFGEGKKYYLNLEEYNKDAQEGKIFYSGKDHANIFEVPDVYDLVHNILKNDDSLPSYVTDTVPPPVDYTIIKMRSPVAIDIYDENKLHTGIVEGINGEEDMLEEGIPNSLYMEIGENKYIVVPKDGDYTLKLEGLSDGIFTLEQEQLVDDIPGDSVVWRDIPTTALFQGEVALNGGMLATSIAMDEDGDGTFESNLAPVDKSLDKEKEDIIRGSFGSYIIKDTIPPNVIMGKEDDVKSEIINKEESNKIVKDLEKKEELKNGMIVNNIESITPVNNLSASVGLVDFNLDKRFILFINIVLSGLIIIVGIKFINKVK